MTHFLLRRQPGRSGTTAHGMPGCTRDYWLEIALGRKTIRLPELYRRKASAEAVCRKINAKLEVREK